MKIKSKKIKWETHKSSITGSIGRQLVFNVAKLGDYTYNIKSPLFGVIKKTFPTNTIDIEKSVIDFCQDDLMNFVLHLLYEVKNDDQRTFS